MRREGYALTSTATHVRRGRGQAAADVRLKNIVFWTEDIRRGIWIQNRLQNSLWKGTTALR